MVIYIGVDVKSSYVFGSEYDYGDLEIEWIWVLVIKLE